MTPFEFSEMLNAKRAGTGRWQARCPAHDDRSPSLTIAEGAEGRVLLHCWAGCSIGAILAALGLTLQALFPNATLTPDERAAAARRTAMRNEEQAHERAMDRAARDRLWKLEQLVNALGAKLAQSPDDAELGKLFHRACDKLHEAETAINETRPAGNGPLERIA